MELVIKKTIHKEKPRLDDFTSEFYQKLKKNYYQFFINSCQSRLSWGHVYPPGGVERVTVASEERQYGVYLPCDWKIKDPQFEWKLLSIW